MARSFLYLKGVTTLRLDTEKCTGCGTCLDVCPQAVLAKENGKVRIQDRDACMECGACSRNCPVEAITVKAGVGCAAAVINAALGRSGSGCCCVIDDEPGSGGNPVSPGTRKSTCC
jgi:ferredoxin